MSSNNNNSNSNMSSFEDRLRLLEKTLDSVGKSRKDYSPGTDNDSEEEEEKEENDGGVMVRGAMRALLKNPTLVLSRIIPHLMAVGGIILLVSMLGSSPYAMFVFMVLFCIIVLYVRQIELKRKLRSTRDCRRCIR